MSKVAEYCRVVPDKNHQIRDWICEALGEPIEEMRDDCTLGFMSGDKLIGGVIFSSLRKGTDVWLTIYATDRTWCNRRTLRTVFDFAFNVQGCKRVSAFIDTDNAASLSLAERLGFRKEGFLRCYRFDGKDAHLMGMLKEECKYL